MFDGLGSVSFAKRFAPTYLTYLGGTFPGSRWRLADVSKRISWLDFVELNELLNS